MAWWNPIDYATEGAKELGSHIPGSAPYDARDPRSQYYGEQKSIITPGRARTPSEIQKVNTGDGASASAGGGGGVLGASIDNSPVAGANNPTNQAAYQQAIGNTNQAINRLGSQFTSGNSAIDASYQNALQQLLLGRNQAQQSYDTTKQQTAQDYVGTKNSIGANAGASLQGLQRLLGSRGAGGSSAATQVAPGAVAREATLQRADAGQTFGQNQQALDTNWGNYMTGYNNSVTDVGAQRDQQRQSLQGNIENNRATLLQSLAQLTSGAGGNAQPYLDQANGILNSQANYQTAPINYQTQAYNAPELASYATGPGAGPTVQGQAPSNDYTSPYLAALLGQNKKQLGA